jgi:hypothetical protein
MKETTDPPFRVVSYRLLQERAKHSATFGGRNCNYESTLEIDAEFWIGGDVQDINEVQEAFLDCREVAWSLPSAPQTVVEVTGNITEFTYSVDPLNSRYVGAKVVLRLTQYPDCINACWHR